MINDPDGYFGADVAASYDDPDSPMFRSEAIDPAVDVLAGLAGDARALEFAIGTGRIGLPLAARGVPVSGIELSRAMVDKLRAKPGGDQIEVAIGDMTSTTVPGDFAVVYLVFNTIMNLTSQRAQIDCFRNAAAHLRPGGCFVVEVMVPDLRRLPPGQNAVPFDVSDRHLGFDTYDTATQAMSSHHINFIDGQPRYSAVPFRYVWPAELDLMAERPGCGCVTGGRTGPVNRSPATAAPTFQSGRSPESDRIQSTLIALMSCCRSRLPVRHFLITSRARSVDSSTFHNNTPATPP